MLHFFKHITVWSICAVLLGTQPTIVNASTASNSSISAYATENTSHSNQGKTSAKEDSSESSSATEATTEKSTSSTTETTEEMEESTTESTEVSSEPATTETEASEATETSTEKKHSTETTSTEAKKDSSSSNTKTDTSSSKTETKSTSSEETTSEKKTSKKEKKDAEETKEVKQLDDTVISEEESAEKEEDPEEIIPKIYGSSQIITKENAEYIGDFVYFNQADSAWNQNGYRIASAGCGPTSMAVVISSLTDQWVTPIDTAIWGYEHGYYSSAGSAHEMIPAMANAYGLNCKGVGTDYDSIKKALKKGKPVVALMGPGYFTRKGHFMVLIGIDENDSVTVADVGSRQRSAYKYALSDIIRQSKSASAGGPFWIISKPKKKTKNKTEQVEAATSYPQTGYVLHKKEGNQETLTTYQLGDRVFYNGTSGIIIKFDHRRAYVLGENGNNLIASDGKETICLDDLKIIKQAPETVHTAVASTVTSQKTP